MLDKKYWGIILYFIVIIGLIVYFTACNELFVLSNPPDMNKTSISFKNDQNSNSPQDVVTIDDAKALITEVEAETSISEDREISRGPFVIHFPLDGTLLTLDTGSIPDGNFTEIKFKIHKPDDNETVPDPEFKDGTSGNQRYSFIIKGTFNGNPFTYKSRQSAAVVLQFNNNINLTASNINITILFNANSWFMSNGVTLDPGNPNNANAIDDNIKNSFKKAFEDNDKNGIPD